MKWSDVTPFALWAAVVVTLGLAMMGGPLWPLCVAGFLMLLYAVANEAPEPVRHDLGIPARTLGHLDTACDHADSVREMFGLPYIGPERRQWRSQR